MEPKKTNDRRSSMKPPKPEPSWLERLRPDDVDPDCYECGFDQDDYIQIVELVTALEALDYDAVLPYLRHAQECRFVKDFPARCSCGLNAILFALGNARDLLARLKGG